MTEGLGARLRAVDRATLTPLVRRNLEDERVEVLNWGYRPVEGGFGGSLGILRFRGEARTPDGSVDWSLILKVFGPAPGRQEPAAVDYWKREALVYRSGLLEELKGDLVAPRCLGVVEGPGEEVWVWLEDVVESGDGVWPLERYGLAARHLGQFNGAYLAGRSLPTYDWLSRGEFRRRLALAEGGVPQIPELRQNPLFEGLLESDMVHRMQALWSERQRLLEVRDRLPQTLCHHDAFRRNLLARAGRDGREQTVAIDWAMTGNGVIGEEMVPLFAASLRFVLIDVDRIPELDRLIYAGYVDGLREAGWRGDPRLARFGYSATAALRTVADIAIKWPRVAEYAASLPDGAEPPRLLNAGGPAQYVPLHRHLVELGEEALALVDILDRLD
jgi:hypothetical protein